MKRFYTFVIVAVLFCSWLNFANAQEVFIPDANLEAAIREGLGLAPNEPITIQAIRRLTFLDASASRDAPPAEKIRALTGLEHATELRELVLAYNAITDLTPLAALTQLANLNLAVNQISNISPIAGLTQLIDLNLGFNRISNISPIAGLTQLIELGLYSNNIRDISSIRGLTQLTSLWLDYNQISDITPLTGLTQLTAVWLSENQISDVSPLAALPQLRILHLTDNQISDITPLAGLVRLRLLYLDENEVSDISPIREMIQMFNLGLTSNRISDLSPLTELGQIEWLWLGSNLISDISPISGLTSLRRLSLTDNQIIDVSPLAGLFNLENLWLAGNPITDTSPLANLTKLEVVDVEITHPPLIPDPNLAAAVRKALGLAPNEPITKEAMSRLTTLDAGRDQPDVLDFPISDITGLEYATQLEELDLWQHRQINDISPLAGLIQLRKLYLGDNIIRDISPLAGLTQLRELHLGDNQINDISPLAGLTQLRNLALYRNQISDISALAGLTQLKWLYLAGNQISDISALAGLTQLKWLGFLGLGGNQISDISPLANLTQLETLELTNNRIHDVSPLAGLVNLTTLWLDGNPIANTSPLGVLLRQNPNLQIDIYISSARAERVLIYTGSVHWIYQSDAIREAETTKNLLQSAGIHAKITQSENYVKQWMLQTTSDSAVDVIIFYGILPNTIYPPENAMPDGSVVENWIETTDGNTILNHADYLGYWSTNINNLNELVYLENGAETLQNLMDNPSIFIPTGLGSGDISMFVTTDGSTLTPSLVNFESDRPFRLDQLQGDWVPEKILASSPGDTQAIWVDPVVLRDGNRGRIAIVHQTAFEDNPKGEVAAELIINYLLADSVILATDINNDGVVNIQDLVLVASSLGETGQNAADVNGDNIVDIRDLVKVAGALGNAAAAPILHPQTLAAMFTTTDVRKWISEAQHLNLTNPTAQKGIRFLEQLLATLIPKNTSLLPNYPNPFNPETWIPYKLSKSADVTLTIYAVDGQIVRQMPLGHQHAGTYQSKSRAVYWDGRNTVGEPVASGLYFYTLTADNFTATRKMLIRK